MSQAAPTEAGRSMREALEATRSAVRHFADACRALQRGTPPSLADAQLALSDDPS